MLYVPVEFDAIPQLLDQGVDEGAIERVLIRVAAKFTPVLQRAAPVDTGALKRSLRVDLLDDLMGVALVSRVFYAGFVEYGTRRMRPRSYAESIVPELIGYANSLLSQLGTVSVSGGVTRVANVDRTDQVMQVVSEDRFRAIRRSVVRGRSVPNMSVSDASLQTAQVNLERVEGYQLLGGGIL